MGWTVIISVLTFLSVTMLAVSVGDYVVARVTAIVAKQEEHHQIALKALFLSDVKPREITYLTVLGAVVIGLIVALTSGSHASGAAAGLLCLVFPKPLLAYMQRKRLKTFEERLPVGLDQLASAAKAGLSLRQAIDEVARAAPAPVNEEFSIIQRDLQLGSSVPQAIRSVRDRLKSRIFDLVATALIVNHDKGGDLPEALVQMSQSLKEIWRLEQKLITASAEGRKAIWVISVVPIFVFLMTLMMQPDLIGQLTGSWLGIAISAIAILLYVGGILWLIRILRIEI